MVFTLISVFLTRRVTQCLVQNGFYFIFSILSETSERYLGLEWFLNSFQCLKQEV